MSRLRLTAVVVWAIGTAGASVIPGFLSGAVAPFARAAFPLSESGVGLAFSGFWLVGAITTAAFVRLASVIGPVNTLRLACIVLIATSGASAVFVRDEPTFIALVTLSGLAPALAVPAASIVIMANVQPRYQAFALTAASASSAIGLLGAGFLVSAWAGPLGWNSMFWLTAALGAILLTVGLWMRVHTAASAPTAPKKRRPLPRRAALVAALLAVGLTNIAIGGATIFVVASAPASGVTVEHAALAAAVASTASIPVRLLLGYVTDRTGKDPLPGVVLLLLAGSAGYLLLSTQTPLGFYVGVGLVLIPGWAWVNVFLYGILARYRQDVGTAAGMVQTTYFAGSVIGPVATGALIDVSSFGTVWVTLGVATLVGAAALWVVRVRLPQFSRGS